MDKLTALYTRISDDRNGRAEGVAVQERYGRSYARKEWPGSPLRVYCDNDLSAAKDDVVRPAFEQLRQDVRDGLVAHVWAVEQSRLERTEVGWFVLAAELDAAGIAEVHTRRDGIVRVRDEVAGIKAVLAAAEVRKITQRINDRLDDNAAAGQPSGATPFGYRHAVGSDPSGRMVKTYRVVPEEAAAVRWAAERVLSGWPLASVAVALVEQGLAGNHKMKARGGAPGRLTAKSVRNMLTNPCVAGLRVHRGMIVGNGNWEPILDVETWRACRARLTGARTIQRSNGPYVVGPAHTGFSGRRWLLTGGVSVCGVCGGALVATMKQLKGGAARGGRDVCYYLCHPNKGGKGCVGIVGEPLEAYVADCLLAQLDRPDFLAMVADDTHAARRAEITDRLGAIEGQQAELARMWAAQDLTSQAWQAARETLADQERELQAELAGCAAPPALVSIGDVRASWPVMTLGERRELVRLFVARVTIVRAKPGTSGFDPDRVVIEWAS